MEDNQQFENENGVGEVEFPSVTDMRKRTMLFALKKNLGIVLQSAKVAGIHRDTHYEWMKLDAAYKLAYESLKEAAIDFAEGKLLELINGVTIRDQKRKGTIYSVPPNVAATIFYLKTKAKHRGYVERSEVTGAEGNPLSIVWEEQRTYDVPHEQTNGQHNGTH